MLAPQLEAKREEDVPPLSQRRASLSRASLQLQGPRLSSSASSSLSSAPAHPWTKALSGPSVGCVLKVVVVGSPAVGKTQLVSQLVRHQFSRDYQPTTGFQFSSKTLRVEGRGVKVQIWDASAEGALTPGAVGVLLVYDVTGRETFLEVQHCLAVVRQLAHKDVLLVLVGNKTDSSHLPGARQVSTLEAARFAEKHSMDFIETSAVDGTNVAEAFKKVVVPIIALLYCPASSSSSSDLQQLPSGWQKVHSRSREGEFSYENVYTKERVAFIPPEPAKPTQANFYDLDFKATVTRDKLYHLQKQQMLLLESVEGGQHQCSLLQPCSSHCTII